MVRLTKELIEAGMSQNGGWNNAQLKLLGLRIPLKHGWKEKLVGDIVSEANYQKFLDLKDDHLRPDGKRMTILAKKIEAAVRKERERCLKIVESTTVVMDGIVIESLNANRAEMVRRIRDE